MKIKSLMLAFALGFASLASAQTYQDVVFLKNGSEIRGVIMEQIPNESLKIKTNDGNLFVFKIDEVSKIAKEEVKRAVRREERDRPAKEEVLSRFHRTTGYAGFVELSGGWEYQDENIEVDLSTSHGVRLGSKIYLGGGIAVKRYYMYECRYEYSPYGNGYEVEEDFEASYCVPIFTDVRVDFSDTKVSPYLDFRLGAAVGDDVSAYVSGSTGVRIAFSPKTALSIGLVIDYFGQEVLEGYDNHGLAGLRVGFEF